MNSNSNYQISTAQETPELIKKNKDFLKQVWPPFFTYHPDPDHTPGIRLNGIFPEFQYWLTESATQRIIAKGNSIPLFWEGNFEQLPNEGFHWAIKQGFTDHSEHRQPNVLCALNINVLPEYRGKEIASLMIQKMKEIAQIHQLPSLIIPARPTLKHLYPLTPIEKYITWQNENNLPFDPWLRLHVNHGAKLINICYESLIITDTITNWEAASNMRFPETGDYIVPGALLSIEIDYAKNQGTYIEPNVWMHYKLV